MELKLLFLKTVFKRGRKIYFVNYIFKSNCILMILWHRMLLFKLPEGYECYTVFLISFIND